MTAAFLLNQRIGLPSHYANLPLAAGPPSSELCLFDYTYVDRNPTERCLEGLAAMRPAPDFASKTLLLACKGLDPAGALLGLVRSFRGHHVLYELWNIPRELAILASASLDHLYFLPVSDRNTRPSPG